MRMTAEYFETHGYENHPGNDQPDAADITRAEYSLYEGKVGYLTESFSEAPDDKRRRVEYGTCWRVRVTGSCRDW